MFPMTITRVPRKLNDKGFGLVEVVIAMFLTAIAVIALLPMQDTSIRTAGKSDLMGRAAGILQTELETIENQIMLGTIPPNIDNQPVNVAGNGVSQGNATFFVTTSIASPATNYWRVNVRVAWPGNCLGASCSVTNSILVTRQSAF